MTTGENPFMVTGHRGTELVRYTAASVVAAAVVADHLRCGFHHAGPRPPLSPACSRRQEPTCSCATDCPSGASPKYAWFHDQH